MAERTRGIQSIEVGGRILQALTDACAPMALKDLTHAADLAPAQCHAYLTSFKTLGFVEQDSQSGQYKLGPFAMRLGMARMRSYPVTDRASRMLIDLSNRLGKVAMMLVWGPHGPTVVQFQNGTAAVTLNLRQGTVYSVTGTASGRVFAAFDRNEVVESAIDAELSGKVTERFVGLTQSRQDFEEAVERDRARRYSATEGMPVPGLNAISVPVFDSSGQMCLAISIFGAAAELPTTPDSPHVLEMIATSRALSG
ncbi:MAG: IclR family transcriptional regulator [Amaricoccus sp.]